MCITCDNVGHMSKMIQIRNVSDRVHGEIKARAARSGMTLSDYLLREVERLVETPSVEELLDRRASRDRIRVSEAPENAVRAERDSR